MENPKIALKPLSKEAIPTAINKAEHYRLLNEPSPAESICLDVLEIEPENQQVLVIMLLALTDQFEHNLNPTFKEAQEVLHRLHDDYNRAYYEGIIWERRAKALFSKGVPRCGYMAYNGFRRAMECFEKAAETRPPGNDDAILRWNNCARTIMRREEIKPAPEDAFQTWLE